MSILFIAALGNNEPQYEKTRHNIGFDWLNQFADKHHVSWQRCSHAQGQIGKLSWKGHNVILFRPGLLMNINGRPIAQCLHYFKIKTEQALLVYDDLDLPPGTIKLKKSTGHGGHNGVRDLHSHINIQNLWRLKIGIGKPTHKSMTSSYVLHRASPEDESVMQEKIAWTISNADLLLDGMTQNFQEKLAHIHKQEDNHGI